MKKSLLALVLGFVGAGTAYASSVTLYGIIEEGVLYTKGKHQDATVQLKSAHDLGSRWGIKGVEDLGNGNQVGFTLEAGFSPDNGATANTTYGANAFTRESILWIQNDKLGRLAFGRAATLGSGLGSYDMQTGYAFMNGYGLIGWDNCMNNFLRVNNAVIYRSPTWAGWTLGLMYSNGVKDDTAKWSKNQHYYGAGLKYAQGPWKSSLILEMETKNKEAAPQTKPKYTINYGVEYNTGSWTPMFTYRWVDQDGNVKGHKFGLSAIIPYASGRFKVAAAYQFGSDERITGAPTRSLTGRSALLMNTRFPRERSSSPSSVMPEAERAGKNTATSTMEISITLGKPTSACTISSNSAEYGSQSFV